MVLKRSTHWQCVRLVILSLAACSQGFLSGPVNSWAQAPLSPTSSRKEFIYLGGRLAAVDAVTGILPPPPVSVVINSPLQGSSNPNSNISLSWTATVNPTLSRCEIRLDSGPWMPYPICNNGSATQTRLSYVHIPDATKALALDFSDNTGTTVYDRSGAAVNGTLQNGAAWTTGKYGTGLSLDGVDDYVSFGDVLDFEGNQPVTFMFWVKPASFGTYIIAKQDNYHWGEGYAITTAATGNVVLSLINNQSTQVLQSTSSLTLTLNAWNHVAVTYDGTRQASGVKFYINGVQATTWVNANSLTGTILTPDPFHIGCREGCTFGRYQGLIDELAMYLRVLSSTEVATMYNDTAFNGSHTFSATGYNPLNQSGTASVTFQIGP